MTDFLAQSLKMDTVVREYQRRVKPIEETIADFVLGQGDLQDAVDAAIARTKLFKEVCATHGLNDYQEA